MIAKLFQILLGVALIIAGGVLEVMWISFLFGSVLGIVLLLIFAPGLFFAPLGVSALGIAMMQIKNT
jgi:hypothetical protein